MDAALKGILLVEFIFILIILFIFYLLKDDY
jgi:hypothetical protein